MCFVAHEKTVETRLRNHEGRSVDWYGTRFEDEKNQGAEAIAEKGLQVAPNEAGPQNPKHQRRIDSLDSD